MDNSRKNKIIQVFKEIHGIKVPMFRWLNYESMRYWYNEFTDSIDCECGTSIRLDISDEDINYDTILDALYNLEDKVREEFQRKHNINLYYED